MSQASVDDDEGRIPTPQLKQSADSKKRHHFDLTTPVVGGSLLSSPPRGEGKPRRSGKRQVKPNVSRSWCVPTGTCANILILSLRFEQILNFTSYGSYENFCFISLAKGLEIYI